MELSTRLLNLIDCVSKSENQQAAYMNLLHPILEVFDMQQAALIELRGSFLQSLFSIDRTKRIIPGAKELWISQSIVHQALLSKEPVFYKDDPFQDQSIPKSIHEHSLKTVLCLPVSSIDKRVIYLASQKDPLREFTPEEIKLAKIAAQSATLALKQRNLFDHLKKENEALSKALKNSAGHFLYASPSIEHLMEEVKKIAAFNLSILVQGESGTGKEELAREIHRKSNRKGPFVAVNCANLTESLLESELFGYHKGAFTGALSNKKGLFEEAHEGTLFLDEIGELPYNLQAKLLRAIQEKKIRPLGSNRDINVDIRIISASLKDLQVAVAEKEFREDLLFRIQEMVFWVPPLRERPEDIELLAHHFIKEFVREFNSAEKVLSADSLASLKNYHFSGNVRELRNICRMAVILSRSTSIEPSDLRFQAAVHPTFFHQHQRKNNEDEVGDSQLGRSLKEMRIHFEKELIRQKLREGLPQEKIAKELEISVRTLQRILTY